MNRSILITKLRQNELLIDRVSKGIGEKVSTLKRLRLAALRDVSDPIALQYIQNFDKTSLQIEGIYIPYFLKTITTYPLVLRKVDLGSESKNGLLYLFLPRCLDECALVLECFISRRGVAGCVCGAIFPNNNKSSSQTFIWLYGLKKRLRDIPYSINFMVYGNPSSDANFWR